MVPDACWEPQMEKALQTIKQNTLRTNHKMGGDDDNKVVLKETQHKKNTQDNQLNSMNPLKLFRREVQWQWISMQWHKKLSV